MSSPPPPRSSGEEPLFEKKKRKKLSLVQPQISESTPVPSLPDDLLLSSFARISRLHYPALSLVSKSFRSLLASPELYEIRSLLGRTESCLYVCLKFPPDPNSRWFTLCRKPIRTIANDNTSEKKKKKEKSSENLLVPIAIPNSPQVYWAGVVTVGSSIYAIGVPINDSPSSDVWVLDCRCHVWRKGPSMSAERYYPAANVVDGKIYVAGGFTGFNSSNWIEVFDPKTQTWEVVVCPLAERCSTWVFKSAVIDGRIFYMFVNEGVVYHPKEDKWEAIEGSANMDSGWTWLSYCVIDNVLFCYSSDRFEWYNSKRQKWMDMKGLKGLPKFASYGYRYIKIADCGGKVAVFWPKCFRASTKKEKRIWCAVISLERRNGVDEDEEIWGTVEWLDPVLTVPNSFDFVRVLAATV